MNELMVWLLWLFANAGDGSAVKKAGGL